MPTVSQALLNDVRMMSLRCFVAVVDTRSFSAAARQLRLSASSVTKQVRALEAALDVALFHRTTRQVSVTPAGERFFRNCQVILGQLDRVTGSLVDEGQLEGHLRIHAPPAFATRVLAPAMHTFMAKHPKLTIDVLLSSSTPDLVRERLDLAVIIRKEPVSKLPHQQLGPCERVVCASPSYLERRGHPDDLAALAEHDLIASRFTGRAEVWEFEVDGVLRPLAHRPRLLSDNGEFLKQACLTGAGIGNFYAFHVRQDLEAGRLVRVMPGCRPVAHRLFALLPHREIVRPQVQAFMMFLREAVSAAGR